MEYQTFVNQEVVNGRGEEGVVLSLDKEDIVIKYPNGIKTYKRYLALHSGFIKFKDVALNQIAQLTQLQETEEINHQLEVEELEKERLRIRREKANELYERLAFRNYVFQNIFGKDFTYPIYERFMKQFGKYIIKCEDDYYSMVRGTIGYHWHYYN